VQLRCNVYGNFGTSNLKKKEEIYEIMERFIVRK
jgi:hypothetical protein